MAEKKVRPDPITRANIEKYLEKDKEITAREHANHQCLLALKQNMLKHCEELLNRLIGYYGVCVKDVSSKSQNKDEILTVHRYLDEHCTYDNEDDTKQLKLSETQEETLDALNRIELAKKDMDSFSNRKHNLNEEINVLTTKVSQLNKAYAEHDKILASCFDGKYGSKMEKDIEVELDKEINRKQRIQLTHFKWNTAKTLCHHAVTQLEFAINRWQEIAIVPATQLQNRYTLTTDVRNHLVCANQNLTTAQKYLADVTFPYCTPQEIDTLHSATVHIYSDVTTVIRHAYALQCFSITHKRAEALVQWFENIINKDMTRDLNAVAESVEDLVLDLREERLRVMKRKLKEVVGDDISLAEFDIKDKERSAYMSDTAVTELSEPPKLTTNDEAQGKGKVRRIQVALVNGSKDDMGYDPTENVEDEVHMIKKQHERDMMIFAQAQNVNKVRMQQGLNEKLQKRRRSKMLQLQELSEALDNSFKPYRNSQMPGHDAVESMEDETTLNTISMA